MKSNLEEKVRSTEMSLLPDDNDEFSLETRDLSPSHLLTKIKSFSNLSKHGISKLESAEFVAGDYKWKLIIYLDGDEVGRKANHISVHLSMVGTSSLPAGWEVHAIFNFFIYNHIRDNHLCFRGKAQRLQAINHETRFSKVIDKSSFLEPSNGYVFDDNCVFGAEVVVLRNQRHVESVSVFDVEYPYRHQWEISNFSKLVNDWSSEQFSAQGYNWQIMLHPNGNGSAKGRYVSIFLHCIDSRSFASHKKIKATCTFCLKNMLEYKKDHSGIAKDWFSRVDSSRGFPKFKAISDMHDGGFVVKDCCRLEIQLSVEAQQEALN